MTNERIKLSGPALAHYQETGEWLSPEDAAKAVDDRRADDMQAFNDRHKLALQTRRAALMEEIAAIDDKLATMDEN